MAEPKAVPDAIGSAPATASDAVSRREEGIRRFGPEPRVDGRGLLRNVLTFGRELHDEGLAADLATVLDYIRALELIDVGDREEVRAAGAALFVRHRDELEPYNRAFTAFWRRRGRRRVLDDVLPPDFRIADERGAEESQRRGEIKKVDESADEGADQDASALTAAPTAWSPTDSQRARAFERMTAAELREAERAIDAMTPRLPLRRTRRWEVHREGLMVAPRQMMRRNLATGGDPLTWLWRRPLRRPRSIVLLCDISGSMERHSRLLLRFSHALVRSRVRTEAFCFGTRLTRITPYLRGRDTDLALARVSAAVGDWSGGTRIGGAFREFNQRWARRVLRSSGIVIIVSDGWDRGDPQVVREETARLRRNCHRLIWLNPLAGSAGYQPLAQGMAAAYPSIDVFLPAHDLPSIRRLVDVLASEDSSRRTTSVPLTVETLR